MKNYLVLPINNDVENKDFFLTPENGSQYGLWCRIDAKNPQYYIYIDITHLGKIKYVSLKTDEYSFANSKPSTLGKETLRPKIHYTVSNGWNNDPNGMVYYDETYHMFYQFNPGGNTWGNMHWGHATSKDMIHFKEEEIGLYPNFMGAKYSGSAIVDFDNVTGLKENENDPIILFYTSAGYRFNQCIAYSTDKGKTFKEYKHNPVITYVTLWNRDPKVIKCEELNCYIMAVYLEESSFILYKSNNLLNWEELQRVDIDGDYECPDIYRLKIEGTDEYRYIIQGACGSYLVGNIENGKFIWSKQPQKCLYGEYIDYCAQSYSNLKDRVVQVNWQKSIVRNDMPWGSNLSLPQEVTLHKDEDGNLNIHTYIAKEFDKVEKELFTGKLPHYECGFDIHAYLDINESSELKCFGVKLPLPECLNNGKIEVRIIADTNGISIYLNKGIKYTTISNVPNYKEKPLEVTNGAINNLITYCVKAF